MSTESPIPLSRHPDLVMMPRGKDNGCVVKNTRTGEFFTLGREESLLLEKLDGQHTVQNIQDSYQEEFHQHLVEEDLKEFLLAAADQGLLAQTNNNSDLQARKPAGNQNILYWRKALFDPNRLLTWLEPRLRFLWTKSFVIFSSLAILLAIALAWSNRNELVSSFTQAARWQTLFWVWLTLVLATLFHEFAHGLTCKHYGGEVHEIGFLLIYFMPAFYCNVSDAWLFREKAKRLWVTFAGAYCDLCLWALAVIGWRLTLPNTLPNYLCWVVITVLGARAFFNLNPLIKLDGYYLLSDLVEVPNLRQRGWDCWLGRLRHWLWGAPRIQEENGSKFLFGYGLASWLFSLTLLGLMAGGLTLILGRAWGVAGIILGIILGVLVMRRVMTGLSSGEFKKMLFQRRRRSTLWVAGLAMAAALLFLVNMEDRSSGAFQVRPATRVELRAPMAGFLHAIAFDEGDRVSQETIVARLDVPDLASRLGQKNAELREAQAKVHLLEEGVRPEEVQEQRKRVERAKEWRDLAQQHLAQGKKALDADLERLDKLVSQAQAELDHAQEVHNRNQKLRSKGVLSEEEFRETDKKRLVVSAILEGARAQKKSKETQGTLEAETELARREKDLADARATLSLLEAGTRTYEIEAEKARMARVQEEVRYLETLQAKIIISSPLAGVITTPRLREKAGQYLKEGDLICVIEEPNILEAEILLTEQDVARVQPGFQVELKARALPFQTFAGKVEKVAPSAILAEASPNGPTLPRAFKADAPGTVTIYCSLDENNADLRSGMTGHARIYCGSKPAGIILADRVLRFFRTEFWW